MGELLEGKKVLVTGVLDRRSIAYSAARLAQEQGAEIVLSGFGRAKRLTKRTAKRLDPEPPILELDVNKPEDIEAVAKDLGERWGELDGIVHAIAFAPEDTLGGNFRPPDLGLLPQSPHRRPHRRSRRWGFGRRPRLRRQDRLARLRLDGGRQGRPGEHVALPGP
jgi:NAD(P)-dependent dehydrogenase (short-subunit alcohol dehydrogenase family)